MDITLDINGLKFAINTFFLLISGALVMWMAAGFAMLEAGMVRTKNTTEILTKNVCLYAIACTCFLVIGYNIMYVSNLEGGILPSFGFLIGEQSPDATHALTADFFFQVVFAATAMSVVSGAVAERMKLWPFLIFSVVLTSFIYPIEGYWTWGGGFLSKMGYVDFAGSGIVHLAGASAALAGVIFLGAREGKYGKNGEVNPIPGSNMPLATIGTLILWFGWFGFNGGSQLALASVSDATNIGLIFLNTNAAASSGAIGALILCKCVWKKVDLTMVLNGALGGLVAITADPASPSPLYAMGIGLIAGVLVVFSIILLDRLRLDDPVGAISVHGSCGILGLLLVPLSNSDASLMPQILGIVVIFAWVFLVSSIVWYSLKVTIGLRVGKSEEIDGLDAHDCGVDAYPEFINLK